MTERKYEMTSNQSVSTRSYTILYIIRYVPVIAKTHMLHDTPSIYKPSPGLIFLTSIERYLQKIKVAIKMSVKGSQDTPRTVK